MRYPTKDRYTKRWARWMANHLARPMLGRCRADDNNALDPDSMVLQVPDPTFIGTIRNSIINLIILVLWR